MMPKNERWMKREAHSKTSRHGRDSSLVEGVVNCNPESTDCHRRGHRHRKSRLRLAKTSSWISLFFFDTNAQQRTIIERFHHQLSRQRWRWHWHCYLQSSIWKVDAALFKILTAKLRSPSPSNFDFCSQLFCGYEKL